MSCSFNLEPTSDSLLISILHPVNLAARRTFCPLRPIANESWSSGTITSALFSFMFVIVTLVTFAGRRALPIKISGSGFHSRISIFSPLSSLTTICTLEPFIPTHVPTASMLSSVVATATFDLSPGSLAIAMILINPS